MGETQMMRASDRDRQEIVDRLRAAVGDGRLRMDEYMERMELAYQAVMLADLAPLQADLPALGSVQGGEPDAQPAAAGLPSETRRPCALASAPRLRGPLR